MQRKYRIRRISVIALIIAIIAVCVGFFFNQKIQADNQAMRQYLSTHFNKNVEIYGVSVDHLTISQATNKINKKAPNILVLTNNGITESHNSQITTINKAEVKKFFDKQISTKPSSRDYSFVNKDLQNGKKSLEKISNQTLDYTISNKKFIFKATKLFPNISYYNGSVHFPDDSGAKQALTDINAQVTTLKKSYPFTTPTGTKITVKNESYGWAINQTKTIKAFENAILDDKTTVDGADMIYGEGYTTGGTGYTTINHGLGKNYIVVSLKDQKLWIYRNNKIVDTVNDVVTGTAQDKGNQTPLGVWYIMYKESPSVLRGYNNDGSKYSSPVKYWMPFTLSGCGLHDADWRTDWSKTAYLRGGSHGCVNIKPSQIKKVWDNVIKHEPVIVY